MKKFGSKAGFTLVELIVVIAILGILAGIAVPAYSGYIKKAQEAKIYSELSIIQTAAQSVAIEDGAVVSGIAISNTGAISVTTTGGPTGYNFDESKIATYATNVTAGTGTATITNWTTIVANMDNKTASWTSAGGGAWSIPAAS